MTHDASLIKKSVKLSEVLAKLMADNAIDAVQLSKKTGIPPTTINRMRSHANSNPTIATLVPLANYFSISLSQLIGTEPLLVNKQSGTYHTDKRTWTTVPLLGWEQVTAWVTNELPDKDQLISQIYTDATSCDRAYALVARGDAMAPRFPAGTLLIFDPSLKPENRDFVIVTLSDGKEPLFRQILIDGSECYLKALNSDFHDNRRVELNGNTKILGILVQARMDVR